MDDLKGAFEFELELYKCDACDHDNGYKSLWIGKELHCVKNCLSSTYESGNNC